MNNKFKNILVKTTLTLSLPLTILLSTPTTQAFDVKSWGGANCQAYFGNQEGDLNKRADGIYNTASTARWVSCGITRDKLFTAPSASGTFAFWVYVNAPAGSTTYCNLREASVTGGNVQTRANNGNPWISLDTSLSQTTGSRTIYCLLPSKARLSHIRSYEYTPTDINS